MIYRTLSLKTSFDNQIVKYCNIAIHTLFLMHARIESIHLFRMLILNAFIYEVLKVEKM